MRQLHLVGFTSDHGGLILAGRRGAKSGGYVVTLDDGLLDQIETARKLQRGETFGGDERPTRARSDSALSPREMQARLRAGRSVEAVAAEAGVAVEWVERFAAPVLAEQASAVARAAQLTLRTPRRGDSDRPLQQSVLRNLVDRGVRLTDDEVANGWSALHVLDNEWLIRFRFRSRGRDMDAEWSVNLGTGLLVARNRLGTDLGFVDPGRHASFAQEILPVRRQAAPPAAATVVDGGVDIEEEAPAPTRRRRRATAASKRGPRRRTVAKRAAKKAPTARKAAPARKRAVVKKAPARKKVAVKKTAAARKASPTKKRAAVKKDSVTRAPARKKATAVRKVAPARKAKTAPKAAPAKRVAAARKVSATRRAPAARRSASAPYGRKADGSPRSKPGRKTDAQRAGAKKATPRKTVAKKAVAKKAVAKKAVAKKAVAARDRAAPYGRKADGTPRSKPGPKRGAAKTARSGSSVASRVGQLLEATLTDGQLQPTRSTLPPRRRPDRPLRARPLRARPLDGEAPVRQRPLRARPRPDEEAAPAPTIRAARVSDTHRVTAPTPVVVLAQGGAGARGIGT